MTDHRTLEAKKKTALRQAIEEIEKRRGSYAKIPIENSTDKALSEECIRSLNEAITILTTLLPTERQQIEEAHSDSWNRSTENWEETPAEYYESTYETP